MQTLNAQKKRNPKGAGHSTSAKKNVRVTRRKKKELKANSLQSCFSKLSSYSPKHQEELCPLARFHCTDRQSTGLTSAFLAENGQDNAAIDIYRPFS